MTESCHFNDKNLLGGSFCVWKGGSIMATTRIMPLHVGKDPTESRAISDLIDYVANLQKTDNGRLIAKATCRRRRILRCIVCHFLVPHYLVRKIRLHPIDKVVFFSIISNIY